MVIEICLKHPGGPTRITGTDVLYIISVNLAGIKTDPPGILSPLRAKGYPKQETRNPGKK